MATIKFSGDMEKILDAIEKLAVLVKKHRARKKKARRTEADKKGMSCG
ncbi:MAG: hypothetical protein ABIH23_19530 [bacterium]